MLDESAATDFSEVVKLGYMTLGFQKYHFRISSDTIKDEQYPA